MQKSRCAVPAMGRGRATRYVVHIARKRPEERIRMITPIEEQDNDDDCGEWTGEELQTHVPQHVPQRKAQ